MSAGEVMHALIVLGGDAPSKDLLYACVEAADWIVAADKGLEALLAAGLQPNLLVGDMDSICQEALSRYRGDVHRLNPIKDDTDGVDALDEALRRGAKEITLLGALGGRMDHALANLMLLVRAANHNARAIIRDDHTMISMVRGEEEIENAVGRTVSLLPLGEAKGVDVTGCFYPLQNGTLAADHPLGISNVITDHRATFAVRQGNVLLFQNLSNK